MREEARIGDYVLISLRDPGLPTYTWFWIKEKEKPNPNEYSSSKIVSPYFNTEQEAMIWADNNPEWRA
jgi:hypothetical protein